MLFKTTNLRSAPILACIPWGVGSVCLGPCPLPARLDVPVSAFWDRMINNGGNPIRSVKKYYISNTFSIPQKYHHISRLNILIHGA